VVVDSVAVPIVGACGTVVAVIEEDAAEAGLVPVELTAVAVKVYAVALARPVAVTGEVLVNVVGEVAGFGVTTYEVGVPPVALAVTVTVADPLLYARLVPTLDAETVGASGTSLISITAFKPSGVPSMRSSCALRIDISYPYPP